MIKVSCVYDKLRDKKREISEDTVLCGLDTHPISVDKSQNLQFFSFIFLNYFCCNQIEIQGPNILK